MTSILNTLR
ncbi:CPXV166 protein, partial [Monkeypox virus]